MIGERQAEPVRPGRGWLAPAIEGGGRASRYEARMTNCAGCGRSIHEVKNLYEVGRVMACDACIRAAVARVQERPRAVARAKRAAPSLPKDADLCYESRERRCLQHRFAPWPKTLTGGSNG